MTTYQLDPSPVREFTSREIAKIIGVQLGYLAGVTLGTAKATGTVITQEELFGSMQTALRLAMEMVTEGGNLEKLGDIIAQNERVAVVMVPVLGMVMDLDNCTPEAARTALGWWAEHETALASLCAMSIGKFSANAAVYDRLFEQVRQQRKA
jgi:hypothetical protein